MKCLTLSLIIMAACSAQTITLTGSDSRCVNSAGTVTCTFQSIEGSIFDDYGVELTATLTGGGTWTIGSESGATCSNPLYQWFAYPDAPNAPTTVSTISANGTVYLSPIRGVGSACSVGTYTHSYTLTNSISGTYTATLVLVVNFRAALPQFLNDCLGGRGVADSSLTGGAQGNCPGGATATGSSVYRQGRVTNIPCADCRPGVDTFNMTAGTTFTDHYGNTHTTVTPGCYATPSDADKSPTSLNGTWVMTQGIGCANGCFIFPRTGASGPTYTFTDTSSGVCEVYFWSNTSDNDFYYFVDPGFGSTSATLFKHATLTACGSPPCAITPVTEWNMPNATYGRGFGTDASHQDMGTHNYYAMNTRFDYSGQVTLNGTAMTWIMGQQLFDPQKFLDQWFSASGGPYVITACADNQHCTITPSSSMQTPTITMGIPYKLCAFNPVLITAAYVAAGNNPVNSYTPICGDLTTQPRPHAYNEAGVPSYISKGIAPDGNIYFHNSQYPSSNYAYFNAASPSGLTISYPWPQHNSGHGYEFGGLCLGPSSGKAGSVGAAVANTGTGWCTVAAHSATWATTDGNQWYMNLLDGAELDSYKFGSYGGLIKGYAVGNGAGAMFWPAATVAFNGGEAAGSRKSPYAMFSNGIASTAPVSWLITNCTNAMPIVCTVFTASDTGMAVNSKVLIGGVQGNTNANGNFTLSAVSSSSGSLHDIWTLQGTTGNGAYTTSTGAATADVTYSANTGADVNVGFLVRDHGWEIRRFDFRSVLYQVDHIDCAFWCNTRVSLSMDAKYACGTVNNGIPDTVYVDCVTTGVDNGTNLQNNFFDSTHGITVTAGATSLSFSYSSPNTNSVIIDLCQSLRWPDTPGSLMTTTDATCKTVTDSSGANPRSNTVTSLTGGATYYWRAVADNSWVATGSMVVVQSGHLVTPPAIRQSGVIVH